MEAFIIDPAKLIGDIVGKYFNNIVNNNRCVIKNTIESMTESHIYISHLNSCKCSKYFQFAGNHKFYHYADRFFRAVECS